MNKRKHPPLLYAWIGLWGLVVIAYAAAGDMARNAGHWELAEEYKWMAIGIFSFLYITSVLLGVVMRR